MHLLREALALWRGAAMQDVDLAGSGAFDAAVTRLDALRLDALEDRFDAEAGLGHGAGLVPELTDLVTAHPLRERLVGALMRALADARRDAEALLLYERTRQSLADALGVDPSPELSDLHVALLRGEAGRRSEGTRTNLRAELSSYVGKDADVAAVRDLVTEHRLATESARTLLDDVPDGAWLVELAAIGADGDVAKATLSGLGLRDTLLGEAPDLAPAERLVAAVRDREMLLVLDNCEHVIEQAAALAHRLLGECRRLRILATSREPLGITGEALWPVLPLTLPEADANPDEIAAAPAVRLLRERAVAARQDLAAAAEYYEQAVAVLSEAGAVEDVVRIRAAQARLYWLLGDTEANGAAMADAERITWPAALAEVALAKVALAKAELARWGGDAEEAVTHHQLGYLADDLAEAREHRATAYRAAAEAGYAPIVAQALVGVADLALRSGRDEHAARLLAASTAVCGLPDRSDPDLARIEEAARSRLGVERFAEAAREGAETPWDELVAVTLAP